MSGGSPRPGPAGTEDPPLPAKVLLVEDEPGIADFIARGLLAQGYVVETALDGAEGERRALADDVDLVVLDRMLPGRDGIEILRAIRRRRPTLPVIILTARGDVPDRVSGLDSGASDYVVKPFSFDELAARVRAHLRQPTTRIRGAAIEMDLLTRKVWRAGRPVTLSAKEFDLLAYFLRHPGQVLSRRQLLGAVWGYGHDPGTNIVEVYVGYLRRKLDRPDLAPPITTVRSAGYRLDGLG